MNILPFVCGLILVFTLLVGTFVYDIKSVVVAEWTLMASARTERAVNNALEQRKFRRAPSAPRKEKKVAAEPMQERRKETTLNLRAITPPPHTAKLNLLPLFNAPGTLSNHILFKTAANLLRLLYQETPLIQNLKKGWEIQLLTELLKKKKAASSSHELADLYPQDPELKTLYYHLLKGTNSYDLEKKSGIPPLGAFFTLEEGEKAIYFYFAPPILLQALLGEKGAREILKAETPDITKPNNHRILDQAEVQEILLKQQSDLSAFEPYCSFSRQIPIKVEITGIDTITGMRKTKSCAKKR